MRKCWTVSMVIPRQCGKDGVSDLWIWNKCWLRGEWPVCSWVSVTDCCQLRGATSFRYLWEGKDFSMELISGHRAECFQWVFQVHLIAARLACRAAELLSGSSLPRRKGGSFFFWLEYPWAACFASVSAYSFGKNFSCPGVQCIWRSTGFLDSGGEEGWWKLDRLAWKDSASLCKWS